MTESVLFFTYWYPDKSNQNYALFVKRHAHCIALNQPVQVLAILITKSNSLFKFHYETYKDENGLLTHTLHFQSVFNKLLYVLLPLHYVFIYRYIKSQIFPEFKFSILHSNILFPCAIMGFWLSKKFKVPHVITEHWSKVDKFFRVSAYKWQGKKALDSAAAITCVSEHLAKTVKCYTNNSFVTIVPNVVDTTLIFYQPDTPKNPVLSFVAVAHWTQPKNPFYYTEALLQLFNEKKLPQFKLVLVGKGPILELVKQKNYPFAIDFKGNLTPALLGEELNRSHIFLHGSDYETFSVIMAEALCCGLPCVVSPVGISAEVIHPGNGFIAQNNVNDWKEKILLCSKTTYNAEEIKAGIFEKYNQASVSKKFSSVYAGLRSK